MSANCFSLRPSAAMTDGQFLPLQAVSSAGLCNTFLECYDLDFLLGAHWRRLLWEWVCVPLLWCGQPSATAPEARWTICWAGWLSWGLLCLTSSLAIWCQRWSASSVCETEVAWSALLENPGLCTIQVGGMTMALYTWIFMEWQSKWLCHTLFDSLPKELLNFKQHCIFAILVFCCACGHSHCVFGMT